MILMLLLALDRELGQEGKGVDIAPDVATEIQTVPREKVQRACTTRSNSKTRESSGECAPLLIDAVHSLADIVSSLTIFSGIIIADRKTKTFPEGLYKVENLVALLSSFFIFYAAYEIASEAWFGHPSDQIRNIQYVVAGILLIMAVAAFFSRYELKIGLQVGSPSLVADARHVTTGLLAYGVILVGIITTYMWRAIDRYVALLVAVLVARIGIEIFIEAVKVLLDATLDYPTLDGIRKILESRPEVTKILGIGGRSSGRSSLSK